MIKVLSKFRFMQLHKIFNQTRNKPFYVIFKSDILYLFFPYIKISSVQKKAMCHVTEVSAFVK